MRLIWLDNPLPFHPRATPAAKLARFAYQTKGNPGFWKVHDALFASQPALEDEDLEHIAKQQGLSWPGFQAASSAGKLQAKLDDSSERAAAFGANGTPSFFINGRRLRGAQPLENFKQLVDEELAKARALVEHGTPRAKVYAELVKGGMAPPEPETKHVAFSPSAATRGDARAPVVIQEFSDFQCPFCKRVEPTLRELEQEFPGSLRIVWRHLPLPFHQHAALAAEAAEEALAQKGSAAFFRYQAGLFDAQGSEGGLERPNLEKLARELGLDLARFGAALDSHTHQAKVAADAAAATSAGINGTPAFLINDYYLSGAQPAAAFRKLIKLALKGAKKPGALAR